ncbi:type II secretion system F family protein [Fervidibacillus halotolerans]|uniref:Type II secretion system F family protein n=1 Tax=Fervidibacillus halotolerans TaxID=2980027 RepID=A0A9E8S0S4_9BACI|nr:type II secretion system F family protein [Fervidibacillus halotolerans]WAA12842.1 type II secretion system F family protein [Fervidibacillus halotolerans]
MATYKYVGRDKSGRMKRGTVSAVNKTEAAKKLRELGVSPREIFETKSVLQKEITIGNAVKQQDFVLYVRQFATLIRAGITIVDATNILAKQTESKMLKKVLGVVEEDLRSGIAFSDAAEKHPKIFPPMFVNMVRAGEVTGSLDETLDRLATYLEKQYNLKKKIQSTMAYPITLLIVIIAVVIFLMVTIIPSFSSLFSQFDAELPAITKFMMNLSSGVQHYWWIAFLVLMLLILLFSIGMKQNDRFQYGVHLFLLKMPIFGKLLQKSAIARLSRTLSSLFSSAIPILQALTIAEKVVGNPVIGKVISDARDSLEKGDQLSDPLSKSWVIPPLVTQMVAVGEQTGQLDFMFSKIADFYEEEVDRTVDGLKSLIEPIMIVLLAVVVGTIVLSIMVPIFQIYQQV